MTNPYIVGPPVHDYDFYGRTALVDELLDVRIGCIYLIGTRRIGKTSLLHRIAKISNHIPLYLNLEREDNQDPIALGRVLLRAYNEAKINYPSLEKSVLTNKQDICDGIEALTGLAKEKNIKL